MAAVRVLVFAAGFVAVVGTVLSQVRTFVLPRAAQVRIPRAVFVGIRGVVNVFVGRKDYATRDRVMALYAPMCLLILTGVWLGLILGGYTAMFWAVDQAGWRQAFDESGSSLFTLGFHRPGSLGATMLSFSEAALGLGVLALLITYLPSMYAAFSRRETMVALLEVRAGAPPSPVEMIVRLHRIGFLDGTADLWQQWETWFADLEESHTSLAALPFYRSPQPDHSWVTAASTMLDGAALMLSTVDAGRLPTAQLCIRSGFVALRRIADYFQIEYDSDPAPTDEISITRDEYDTAVAELAAAGVPLRPDREQAWRDFAGWRVNYDAVVLGLAALTMAAPALWSSDRAGNYRRPPVSMRNRRTG